MNLLSVKNLIIDFASQGQYKRVVDHIHFDIQAGKTLALVGASGSGKTVTALSILQLLSNQNLCKVSGDIIFHNQNLLSLNVKQINAIRGKFIGMIFQEPMTALNPLHTVDRQILESLTIHSNLSPQQKLYRLEELFNLVGLSQLTSRHKVYPHELSGGQRQRVMIAMSLANHPQLLIADEPTTALDVTTQAGILQLLADLQQHLNLAILLISHDLRMVKQIAHNVCVMNQGQIIERGTVQDIWHRPVHPYTQSLLQAEPGVMIEKAVQDDRPDLLSVKNLYVKYQDKKGLFNFGKQFTTVLNQVCFSVKAGQTLGVVGESGSGKTTLANALVKLIPFQGEVCYHGVSLSSSAKSQIKAYRRAVQLVFQDPFGSLNPRFMVQQILQEGLDIHAPHLSLAEKKLQVNQAIEDVGLNVNDLIKYPHQFSGGQRQRIALARVLVIKPQLIILDEPTSALDRLVQKDILELLVTMQHKYNLSYILISHDLSVIRAIAHQVIVLQHGRVVECDLADNIFNHPQHAYTQQLMAAAFGKLV